MLSTEFKENVAEAFDASLTILNENSKLSDFLGIFSYKISELAKTTDDINYYTLLSKVKEYQTINDRPGTDMYFPEIYGVLEKISVSISARQKAFLKYLRKVMLFLDTNIPVSQVLDIRGLRIILNSDEFEDTDKSVMQCYVIAEKVARYFIESQGFLPVRAEPLTCSAQLSESFKQQNRIYIPTLETRQFYFTDCSFLKSAIKDYILFPKASGYQSLHFIMHNMLMSEHFIEFQIRTNHMHYIAENGTVANHSSYDALRYGIYWDNFCSNNYDNILGLNSAIVF